MTTLRHLLYEIDGTRTLVIESATGGRWRASIVSLRNGLDASGIGSTIQDAVAHALGEPAWCGRAFPDVSFPSCVPPVFLTIETVGAASWIARFGNYTDEQPPSSWQARGRTCGEALRNLSNVMVCR